MRKTGESQMRSDEQIQVQQGCSWLKQRGGVALFPLLVSGLMLTSAWGAGAGLKKKVLPLPGECFEVEGRPAFVILPSSEHILTNRPQPWVWYAPTLPNLP
jgi:hypothetical protein